MSRLASAIAVVLAVSTAALILLGYLAYGLRTQPEGASVNASVAASVVIDATDDDRIRVRAGSLADVLRGVGYGAASERTWQLALLQRTALGDLGSWGGDSLLVADALVKRLRIPSAALAAYERLDAGDRDLLDAYADGINLAFNSPSVRRNRYLLLGRMPLSEWLPWHTLAIERLMAWLVADRSAPLPAPILEADRILGDMLGLHGFDNSLSLAMQSERVAGLYVRYVVGSSALPYLTGAALQVRGVNLDGLLWPGTPFPVAGSSPRTAWTVLPESSLRVTDSVATGSFDEVFYRLRSANGEEEVVSASYESGALVLPGETDSTFTFVHWSGLSRDSDASVWLELVRRALRDTLNDRSGSMERTSELLGLSSDRASAGRSFDLMNPRASMVDRLTGRATAGPASSAAGTSGRLTSSPRWISTLAARLDTLAVESAPYDPVAWFADTHSEWGRRIARHILTAADSAGIADGLQAEALSYLRNWNYSFASVSIAATIVDQWAAACPGEAERGVHDARLVPPDTVAGDRTYRRYMQCLETAVSNLERGLGRDLSQWRWEGMSPGQLRIPGSRHVASGRRRGPFSSGIRAAASGHPSTLSWASGRVFEDVPSPAAWEAWIDLDTWRWSHRRLLLNLTRPLGSHLHSPPERRVYPGSGSRERRIATLVPSDISHAATR